MDGFTQACSPRIAWRELVRPAHGRFGTDVPEGRALLRPIYWIAAGVACGAAFYWEGLTGLTVGVAVCIALNAFSEPRTALWQSVGFMVYLFVFFQQTAPLGEDLPAEFLFWGIGLALITLGLCLATLFSARVDWVQAKKRVAHPASLAMLAMLAVIGASSVYGLSAGNDAFVVARQLFGCVLLPIYYFLGLVLFRSPADVALWLRRAKWLVTLGALWYAAKLLRASQASGSYYREQSPLAIYGGAVAVLALCEIAARHRFAPRLVALFQLSLCLLAALLMGSRSTLGSFLAGGAALILLLVWKRHMLVFALLLAVLPVGMGVFPYLSTRLLAAPGLTGEIAGRFLFVLDRDRSYLGRVAQTEVVLNTVNQRPVLGAGMGSENSFVMPGVGRLKVASVDNGWGYLLLKMGYVGFAVFLLLIAAVLRRGLSGLGSVSFESLRSLRLAVLAVFLYALVTFIAGPTFFHFSTAPFFATLIGALAVVSEVPDPVGDASVQRCAP
jgi:O-Antigen ligase